MTFSRYNPSGYNPGDRLPAACVNQLDLNLMRAIDGYAGGSYTPSVAISIGGQGLSVSGNFACGNALITGTVGFGGASVTTVAAGGSFSFESGAGLGLAARANATCTAYTRTVYIDASTPGWGDATFIQDNSGGTLFWTTTQSDACYLYLPVSMVPLAASITEIEAQVCGATGHGGLPSNMPSLGIMRTDPDGTSPTSAGSQSDTSATVGAYEATHPITLTGLNLQPTNYVWKIVVTSESGTNAMADLKVYSIGITWSTNSIGL